MNAENPQRADAAHDPIGWGVQIGWMSKQYSPGPVPDEWEEDELAVELAAEEGDDVADYGRQVGLDPLEASEAGAGMEPSHAAGEDFRLDPRWVEWLTAHVGDDQWLYLFVEDRDKLSFRHTRNKRLGEESTTCYAPVEMFLSDVSERDVLRGLIRELYVYAAKKRGWSPPPPMPPYHESASN